MYSHPNETNLKLLAVEKSINGRTYIHIGTSRGSTSIYKIDLNGRLLFSVNAGYLANLSKTVVNSVHATSDGGCIFASNFESWSSNWAQLSYITKIGSSGSTQWTASIPFFYPQPNFQAQEIYDLAVLPSGSVACLAMDSLYFLDASGHAKYSLNFKGSGKIFSFPNGDLYLECGSFRGRMDTLGNRIWTNPYSICHYDTNLYRLLNNKLYKLNGMTGAIVDSIPFPQTGLTSLLMLSDGGWCSYNSTMIKRFDALGNLKWTESIQLPLYGVNTFGEQSDGTILCGGTYRSKQAMHNEFDYSSFISTIDSTGSSILDSTTQVWPGDANDDGIVEFSDIVYIALAQGSTGPNRIDSSCLNYNTTYPIGGGYECGDIGVDFPGNFGIGVNHKQCDVYTDGIINNADMTELAKISNQQIQTFWRTQDPNQLNSSLPTFSLVPSQDTLFSGDTVRVFVTLGGNNIAVDSIFGLAFQLDNPASNFWTCARVIGSSKMNSNFGLTSDVRFIRYLPDFSFVISKINLQNSYNVQDTIAYIDIKISDTITMNRTLNLNPGSFKAITASGYPIDLQVNSIPIYTRSIIAASPEIQLNKISVYPNPATDQLTLNHLPDNDLQIRILNSQGKICISTVTKKSNSLSLSLDNLESGIYFIRISDSESNEFSMKFIKN